MYNLFFFLFLYMLKVIYVNFLKLNSYVRFQLKFALAKGKKRRLSHTPLGSEVV